MPLTLEEQYRLAALDAEFRHRVAAACFVQAIAQLNLPPLPNSTAQTQRMNLISNIFHDTNYAVDLFAHAIVATVTVDIDGLTDAVLQTSVAGMFDAASQQYPVT